ncbi:MAG TPA: hypothetical protein VGP61_04070, partial [Gemmatimonadales bacterium]|nr:hypothetical protein [Gemmatimonadales bacterium]
MQSRIGAGVVAGLVAGIVFGLMMQFSSGKTPEGMEVSGMLMVAKVVRSNSLAVGWLYHLFNSAAIGGLFGLLLGAKLLSVAAGVLWGALYGVFWWILGGLILMPVLLGMPAFAALRDPMMRPQAWG